MPKPEAAMSIDAPAVPAEEAPPAAAAVAEAPVLPAAVEAVAQVVRVAPAALAEDAPETMEPGGAPLLERFFLRRLQRGDQKAFRELVRRHQDQVFSLCLRMLGDRHEAEDVGQEVFVAVHRHLPRFRGESKLSTWIYRVAKNHCLNRLKYLERRESEGDEALERMDAAEAGVEFLTRPERPDRALLGAEERNEVQKALALLSAEHRLLVVLRDIEGLAYEEIARIADLPAGTVKSRLHRARAHLAEVLAGAGMAPEGSGREET